MIPVDDPLQCLYADEWDKMTLAEGMDYVLWTSGKPFYLSKFLLQSMMNCKSMI